MTESSSTSIEFKHLQPEDYLRQHLDKGLRPDGRDGGLLGARPVSLSVGSLSSADGSAIVKQGETSVACGIKLELAAPDPSTPTLGYIIPNLDLPPMCSALFKPGPPSELAQTGSDFLRRVLSNSGMIDPKDLCVSEGKLVWAVYIDIVCLNYDGSVLDCAVKAMVAALKNVRVPKVMVEEDEDNVISTDSTVSLCTKTAPSPLTLHCSPVSVTVGAFFEDNRLLLDLTSEEESLCTGEVTVVLDGSDAEVCQLEKSGGGAMTRERLQECTALAKKHAKTIRKAIEKATKFEKM